MDVGVMRVAMDDPRVDVDVRVRLAGGIVRTVRMLMMSIVLMPVLVGHGLMDMLMGVPLDQMEV